MQAPRPIARLAVVAATAGVAIAPAATAHAAASRHTASQIKGHAAPLVRARHTAPATRLDGYTKKGP
jgi:hypothetical protein